MDYHSRFLRLLRSLGMTIPFVGKISGGTQNLRIRLCKLPPQNILMNRRHSEHVKHAKESRFQFSVFNFQFIPDTRTLQYQAARRGCDRASLSAHQWPCQHQ